jgi:hypothetical protein
MEPSLSDARRDHRDASPYLLLRQTHVALIALDGAVSTKDKQFYEGKVATTQFFARSVLPKITAERAIAEATDLLPMEVGEAAF